MCPLRSSMCPPGLPTPPDHSTRRFTLRFLAGQALLSTVGMKEKISVTSGQDGIRRRRWGLPRARAAGAASAAVLTLAGCGTAGSGSAVAPSPMSISSVAFIQGVLGQRYTCHGAKISPPLNWSGAPPGTKSLALVVDDSSAPITPYIYWLVYDIGPGTTGIRAGSLPTGARQAANSQGAPAHHAPGPARHPNW